VQLRRAVLALVVLAGARAAHADVEASSTVTLFRESSSNNPIQVVHPQLDLAADLGKWAGVNAGYEVDVVSGATPRAFGSATETSAGVDAVTSATHFEDQRQQARGGLAVNTPLVGLTAGYSYGWEKDYRSHTVSASARGDFLERNFTLSLAYTRNFDSVCDQNNQNAQGPLDLLALASSEDCFKVGVEDVVQRKVATHTFEPTEFHHHFSSAIPPALRINPGDTVKTWSVDAGGTDAKGVRRTSGGNPQTGPFFVTGAVPGDTLVIHFNRIRLNRDSAISGGLITNDALSSGYVEQRKKAKDYNSDWKLDRAAGFAMLEKPTEALKNYKVPLAPMLGCVGVAPPGGNQYRTGYLANFGGNLDYNQVREGVTVYLPVYVPGALLFVGDGHAAQGAGELTGDALETSMDIEFTVNLVRGRATQAPRMENDEWLMASGIANSLPEALQQAVSGAGGGQGGAGRPPSSTPTLDEYGRDLTAMARNGEIDPVIGREQEIEQTVEVLSRRRKNNPVLIGEAGVGKTAVVEGLAQCVSVGSVPQSLKAARILSLSHINLIAGTSCSA